MKERQNSVIYHSKPLKSVHRPHKKAIFFKNILVIKKNILFLHPQFTKLLQ